MDQDEALKLIAKISKHLKSTTKEEKEQLTIFQNKLVKSLSSKRRYGIKNPLKTRRISSQEEVGDEEEIKTLKKLIKKTTSTKEDENVVLELRNSNDFINSYKNIIDKKEDLTSLLSFNGIQISGIEGPFEGIDDSNWYIDRIRVKDQLKSLYIEGQSSPALLFEVKEIVSPSKGFDFKPFGNATRIFGEFAPLIDLTASRIRLLNKLAPEKGKVVPEKDKTAPTIKTRDPFKDPRAPRVGKTAPKLDPVALFEISGNTIWIRSNLLSPDAPEDLYSALRISKGTLFLNKPPKSNSNDKIVVTKTTSMVVNLNLLQTQPDSDQSGEFGVDIREGEMNYPRQSRRDIRITVADFCAVLYNSISLDFGDIS